MQSELDRTGSGRLKALGITAHLSWALVLASFLLSPRPALVGRIPETALLAAALGLLSIPYFRWVAYLCRPGGPPIRSRMTMLIFTITVVFGGGEYLFRSNAHKRDRIGRYHPFLQNRIERNDAALHTNSLGFRADEITKEKPEGTLRIFVMGGSTVFCGSATFEQSHCHRLQEKLRARFPEREIEVINAGVPWYTSQHSLINYLFNIRDFEPDIVILWHGINDLYHSFSPPKLGFGEYERDYSQYHGAVGRAIFSHFGPPTRATTGIETIDRLILAVERLPVATPKPVEIEQFASLDAFRKNLVAISERMALDGVQLVLCTQANLLRHDLEPEARESLWFAERFCVEDGVYPDFPSMVDGLASFNDVTREVAGECGVPLIDLEQSIEKSTENFLDECHYTAKGNGRVATALTQALLTSGVLTLE